MRTKDVILGYSLEEIMPITKVARGFNALVARIRKQSLQKDIMLATVIPNSNEIYNGLEQIEEEAFEEASEIWKKLEEKPI